MTLTSRQKKILREIILVDGYITVNQIAQSLGVSSRTVLRELPELEVYFKEKGEKLEKKTGLGIKANITLELRQNILDNLSNEAEFIIYTKEERVLRILSLLLNTKEPIKTYLFTSELGVTEATVFADFNKCQVWLNKNGLKLIKKPGVGIFAQGEERNFRKAIINLFYENFDITKASLSSKTFKENLESLSLSKLIDKEKVIKIKEHLEKYPEFTQIYSGGRTFLGIVIHIYLMEKRIDAHESIRFKPEVLSELEKTLEYPFAKTLALGLEKEFNTLITKDEIGYLTMILKGAQGLEKVDPRNSDKIPEQVTLEIIRIAEEKTGYILSTNLDFYNGLLAHMVPAISRLEMDLDIRNPLLDDIKLYYNDLYELAKECSVALQKSVNKKVPEGEIAYMAVHLAVALEGKAKNKGRYRVIVACNAGIVSARLLAKRIEKEYPAIEIIDITSRDDINQKIIDTQKIDIVISTTQIEGINSPYIVVSPFLIGKDLQQINKCLNNIMPQKTTHNNSIDSKNLKNRLKELGEYVDGMMEILDSYFFFANEEIDTMEQLILEAASKVTEKEIQADKNQLYLDLYQRELLGSTVIPETQIMLLHCRSKGVKKIHLGVIRPAKWILGLNYEDIEIKGVLAMIIPNGAPKSYSEILGRISQELIDNPALGQKIVEANNDNIYDALEGILTQLYEEKKKQI